MKIRGDAGDSIYNDGQEGGYCVYVSVHNTTLDPSTGIDYATNLLRMMSNIIGTNESSCPFYLVSQETYGSGDHNHKTAQNQLALLASLF